MASGAKRQRYSVAEALDIIFDDGSEHGGMSSGEESGRSVSGQPWRPVVHFTALTICGF